MPEPLRGLAARCSLLAVVAAAALPCLLPRTLGCQTPAPPAAAAAALCLQALFSDHMVLPPDTEVIVRGRCHAGASVELHSSWRSKPVAGTAEADGRFALRLPTPAAGGPFEFTVKSGAEARTVTDVLAGDVWLGSGQSNMEMPVGDGGSWKTGVFDWRQEVAAASYPQLRLFTVERTVAGAAVEDVRGHWQACTPESANAFSAAALFFGRELQRARPGPLGLVVSSVGGTVCEAWTSAEGLRAFPEFAPGIAEVTAADAGALKLPQRRAAWWRTVSERDPVVAGHRPEDPAATDDEWQPVVMPHVWSKDAAAALDGFDGVAWYRRRLDIPAAWAGQDLVVLLGAIDDMDSVWFAGQKLGGAEEPGRWDQPREYRVPGARVAAGATTLCVRVVDTGGEGGFRADAESMRLSPAVGESGGVGLAGAWLFHRGAALAELPPFPESSDGPNRPTVLWNGMVAPLVPFPFRGVLWYQGESNRTRAEQYARLFPAMITDWRRAFGRELPFYFVQIAPFAYDDDRGEAFALRLSQAQALRLPQTGMVVTADIGEADDIHPRDKQSVGRRLARLALRWTHGDQAIDADSPRVAGVEQQDGVLTLVFAGAGRGLRAVAGGCRQFEIAGDDRAFAPATAEVLPDRVRLRAAAVPQPKFARYLFAAAAAGELWGGNDLPVGPFEARVDHAR